MAPLVGGGILCPVESVTEVSFAQELDKVAGIDAWVIRQGREIFGLASRVQDATRYDYRTFTVRTWRRSGALTEYEKRLHQMSTPGAIFPYWTVQAYVNGPGALSRGAYTLTKNVIWAVRQGWSDGPSRLREGCTCPCACIETTRPGRQPGSYVPGNEHFVAVNWRRFRDDPNFGELLP
jgi:hypothetical protein